MNHYDEIRAYDPARDEDALYALWQATLGDTWPLTREHLRRTMLGSALYRPGDHLVAVADGRIVGFCGTQLHAAEPRGEIMLLAVAPERQRRGIGSALLAAGMARLRERGAAVVQLGGGAGSYFWPGVPRNLPAAIGFFAARGWEYAYDAADMAQDLRDYATPPYVWERVARAGVTLRVATADDLPALLAFEEARFPHWAAGLRVRPPQDADEFVLAADAAGRIVGTAFMHSPGRGGVPWPLLLGPEGGAFGAVGVAPDMRERGIGLALSALASETLKARGTRLCHVGWVWSVDWYAKLGYRVWREFAMSHRAL